MNKNEGKNRKKVWHLISNRWNSAITEYCLSAARGLKTQGVDSTITALAGSPASRRARALGIDCIEVTNFSISQLRAFRNLARKVQPDFVICYGGPESFLCHFLPPSIQPALFRFRGDAKSYYAPSAWRQRLDRQKWRGIISPAQCLSKVLQAQKPKWQVQTVALGCDADFFSPTPLGAESKRPEILLVGRFDPVKGHKEFLPLFLKTLALWQAGPQPKLVIVGEDSHFSATDLQMGIDHLGLGKDCEIINERVKDLATYMSRAKVGIISSLGSEIICRVAHEFLLSGTPLFVSGVGATKESLFSSMAGLCYQGQDLESAAKDLVTLISQSTQENTQDKQARAAVAKDYFSLEAMGKNLSAILR